MDGFCHSATMIKSHIVLCNPNMLSLSTNQHRDSKFCFRLLFKSGKQKNISWSLRKLFRPIIVLKDSENVHFPLMHSFRNLHITATQLTARCFQNPSKQIRQLFKAVYGVNVFSCNFFQLSFEFLIISNTNCNNFNSLFLKCKLWTEQLSNVALMTKETLWNEKKMKIIGDIRGWNHRNGNLSCNKGISCVSFSVHPFFYLLLHPDLPCNH